MAGALRSRAGRRDGGRAEARSGGVLGRLSFDRPGFRLAVELDLPERGVAGIFGPSGSGKTTLLRCVAGLEPGARGRLEVGGELWQDDATGHRTPTHRRPLGYVFQESSLFTHLSVRGNLRYGWRRVPERRRRLHPREAARRFGLERLLDRRVDDLSGGERQRVALARTLLAHPRLLLLDEPLASLDDTARSEILGELERLVREVEVPVLYVSHDLGGVGRLADHLLVLDRGSVVAQGPLTELLTRLDLPLAGRPDAEAVLEATVGGHDEEFHLTRLDSEAGPLWVPGESVEIGWTVRVRVLARDVSLTLARQTGTSILNIVPATVAELREEDDAQTLVRLRVGEAALLARVTRRSAQHLGLRPGLELWAQVKSAALLR